MKTRGFILVHVAQSGQSFSFKADVFAVLLTCHLLFELVDGQRHWNVVSCAHVVIQLACLVRLFDGTQRDTDVPGLALYENR